MQWSVRWALVQEQVTGLCKMLQSLQKRNTAVSTVLRQNTFNEHICCVLLIARKSADALLEIIRQLQTQESM